MEPVIIILKDELAVEHYISGRAIATGSPTVYIYEPANKFVYFTGKHHTLAAQMIPLLTAYIVHWFNGDIEKTQRTRDALGALVDPENHDDPRNRDVIDEMCILDTVDNIVKYDDIKRRIANVKSI